MQNKETLLQLVERLRGAGQQTHLKECEFPDRANRTACWCGADNHNAVVDKAAAALVAEIKDAEPTSGHMWRCGCGHYNAIAYRTCAVCNRRLGERT